MNLKEAVKVCLGKKYADFSTRASREECGYFFVAEYTLLFKGNPKIIFEMLRTYLKYI